jgi:hypothetical protein
MNNHRLISTKSVQSPNEAQNRNHHFNVSFQKIMKSSTKVKKNGKRLCYAKYAKAFCYAKYE